MPEPLGIRRMSALLSYVGPGVRSHIGLLGWGVAAVSVAALAWSWWRRRPAAAARGLAELVLFRAARNDALTRLSSRDVLIEEIGVVLSKAIPAALLLIDIDDFSGLNGRHGYRVGDEILVAVAQRLRGLSPVAAHVARIGADRFGLLTTASGKLDRVEATALAILRSLSAPIACGAGLLDCRVSIGLVLLPEQAEDADDALRAAGAALDHIRAAGGAGWRYYDPDRDDAARRRAGMAAELRAGLSAGQVIPFYQPVIDLVDGRLVGLEVLARWQHPTRGLLPPDLFIPLAEELNLTGHITETLMRRVIADARDWPAWLYFAFNVSPGQLRELIGMIRNPPLWPEGTLDPQRLEVEVTESALMEDIDVAREVIALLQLRGTRVVLDDFGTGYSNFFHLRELPFDRIKIDRSFVLDVATDKRAEACVCAMLALGSRLGIPMVAEGVESAATEARMAELGCRFGQGFHYSEPVPQSGVAGLLRVFSGREKAGRKEALLF